MKKTFTLIAAMCALMTGAAWATTESHDSWSQTDSPFLAPVGDDGLGYDIGPGVDPIYSTPSIYEDSGHRYPAFVPNDLYVEYFSNMAFNGGHGHVQVTNAVLTIPFVNPRRATWAGWHLDVKGTARLTWLDCSGRNLLDEDNLYTIGLQAIVSRALGQSSQLQLGFTPQYSSDFDLMSHHNFYWGGYAAFSSKAGDKLRYTLGVGFVPDYYRSIVLPLIGLQWRYNPNWELRVEGMRLSSVCVASERFHWGPFFQWNNAVWTVHRERQTRQFRMNNAIIGLGATYGLKLASGGTLGFLGDVGCSFNNVFRVRDASGEHTLEKYRAHPGLYARLGLRYAF